jgi:hypothetical protein
MVLIMPSMMLAAPSLETRNRLHCEIRLARLAYRAQATAPILDSTAADIRWAARPSSITAVDAETPQGRARTAKGRERPWIVLR